LFTLDVPRKKSNRYFCIEKEKSGHVGIRIVPWHPIRLHPRPTISVFLNAGKLYSIPCHELRALSREHLVANRCFPMLVHLKEYDADILAFTEANCFGGATWNQEPPAHVFKRRSVV